MPYVIDRRRALWVGEVVAVVGLRQPGVRSRVILRDNSLYHTLTRPGTLARKIRAAMESRQEGRRIRTSDGTTRTA